MGSMSGQMSGLSTCGMDAKQQLHFPLSQRRKRRVLFTQAQVRRPCTGGQVGEDRYSGGQVVEDR